MIAVDILREEMEKANGDLTLWQEDWIVKAMDRYAEQQVKNYSIPDVTKRVFHFDYITHVSTNSNGHLRGSTDTDEIKAWDEEHATLLFKEKHPDTPFDPPY